VEGREGGREGRASKHPEANAFLVSPFTGRYGALSALVDICLWARMMIILGRTGILGCLVCGKKLGNSNLFAAVRNGVLLRRGRVRATLQSRRVKEGGVEEWMKVLVSSARPTA
jgi:hypothetical protein